MVVASIVALLYLVAATLKPWMVSTFVIWNFALTSFLPSYIYAIALGFLIYTIIALLSERKWTMAGLGLAFMALGGLRLDYSYFTMLALVGMLLMATTFSGIISNPERGITPSKNPYPFLLEKIRE